MSNQPSPGPLPPDASEEMPLELFFPHYCTDAACHFRDFSALLCWQIPALEFSTDRWFSGAFALSARGFLKDLLGVSFIK
jgi:hypothetical protein